MLLLEISKSRNFSSAHYYYYSKLYFTHKNMTAAPIWKKNSVLRPDHFSGSNLQFGRECKQASHAKKKIGKVVVRYKLT